MFGFSSLTCGDCIFFDKDNLDSDKEYKCPKKDRYYAEDSPACSDDFEANFYVMTAYCDIKGLPHNCDEMKDLVALRKQHMSEDLEGKSFLDEYDSIGPILAVRLKADMYRTDIVRDLEEHYIHPAMEMMHMGNFDGAQTSYIEMVESLKVRYGYSPKKETDKVKTYE